MTKWDQEFRERLTELVTRRATAGTATMRREEDEDDMNGLAMFLCFSEVDVTVR